MLRAPAIAAAARRPSRPACLGRLIALSLILAGLAACTPAGDPNHPLRGAATAVGFATTTGEPKDFVKASRSGKELAFIPVGRGGIERPVAARNAEGARGLEAELDRQRDESDAFARRTLPPGAYGAPLPSVAAPPRPAPGAGRARAAGRPEQPTAGQPESYPVSANRLRQIRENAQRANDN